MGLPLYRGKTCDSLLPNQRSSKLTTVSLIFQQTRNMKRGVNYMLEGL